MEEVSKREQEMEKAIMVFCDAVDRLRISLNMEPTRSLTQLEQHAYKMFKKILNGE